MSTTRPSAHLTWDELACNDRLKTPYPLDWRHTSSDRLEQLTSVFEFLRSALGGGPLSLSSAYRTPAHNQSIGGASLSQHVQGRALDIKAPPGPVEEFHLRVATAFLKAPAVSPARTLGGLGYYPWGVHIDTRPRGAHDLVTVWSEGGFKV